VGIDQARGAQVYALEVFFPDDPRPRHVERLNAATEVLTRIAELLAEHVGCDKVVVTFNSRRLFSVDCKGNTETG
jgi:hypothetical protein